MCGLLGCVPVWLLDIDGVINALADPPDTKVWSARRWVRAKAESAHGIEWEILAATPVLEFLRKVTADGRAEILWHSTWQHHAVNVGAALGLPEWPVLPCPEFEMDSTAIAVPLRNRVSSWWKLPAALRVLEGGDALLWTDDDARFQLRRGDTAAWGDKALVIAPTAAKGLTGKHLRRIDAWLTNQGRQAREGGSRGPLRVVAAGSPVGQEGAQRIGESVQVSCLEQQPARPGVLRD